MAELTAQPTSVQSLYNLFRETKLFVNRKYQRKLVWTQLEKQKLIESIMKRYPIPAILIAEIDNRPGEYEIIDGLQRLHAIVSFIETAFPDLEGRAFNLEHFPTARSYAVAGKFEISDIDQKISQKDVSAILDYSLALSVMRNATEAEVNDVFDRINTYGHRLSDQERRQSGVQNDFAHMVRAIACNFRGDTSQEVLPLYQMPAISIDLPKSKHGYQVKADEVFWVQQGILRSTDLRDSMDEQCIADISACVVGGKIIDRSKDALDEVYTEESGESSRILNALKIYGPDKFADEIAYCVSEVLKVCGAGNSEKLRDFIFKRRTTNAFPSAFAVIVIAFHELIFTESNIISDYEMAKSRLRGISERIESGKKATPSAERRKNVDAIKGLISNAFVKTTPKALEKTVYGNHSSIDIDSAIRRSEIELANYELKQGLLALTEGGGIDQKMIGKVVNTIAAIANIGPDSSGRILIGVTDSEKDAKKAVAVDGIEPRSVGKRFVVGVRREANRLGITMEQYLALWRDGIKHSQLSPHVRDTALSRIDFNEYYGLGVIVITVPAQNELSYVGDDVYWRESDSTVKATENKQIVALAKRF